MPLTIKILVTGLAALIPNGNGEVAVVLPTVSHPEHHAFLGYSPDQWKFDSASIEPLAGDQFNWIKLNDLEIRFRNARTKPTNDDPHRSWRQRIVGNTLPNPDRCSPIEPCPELQAIDWTPEMAKVAHRFAPIDPTCLGRNEYGLIQARAVFEFTEFQTCRLSGDYQEDRDVVQVRAYDFKLPDGSTRRQALAAGVLYRIETLHTEDACGRVRISIQSIADDDVVATLSSQGDCKKDLELALLNLLDKNAKDHSGHFRAYFAMADQPPLVDELLPNPEESDRGVEVANRVMKASCLSPFLLDRVFPRSLRNSASVLPPGVPPGTKLATPDRYEAAGPPLCTPMRMEKPD